MTSPVKAKLPLMGDQDNILLVIGQLLEANKAAADGIKNLNNEVRQNSVAVIAAAKTLEILEQAVSQLNVVVRTGNGRDSLQAVVSNLTQSTAALQTHVQQVQDQLDGLHQAKHQQKGAAWVGWAVLVVVSWSITTGIALYGALKGH